VFALGKVEPFNAVALGARWLLHPCCCVVALIFCTDLFVASSLLCVSCCLGDWWCITLFRLLLGGEFRGAVL
jgi:hypothetical protein